MHSFGRGDGFAADDLRPHFYDLYRSGMELAKPLMVERESGPGYNDLVFEVLDDLVSLVNAHPHTSAYFGIQSNKESRQLLYVGFKEISNLALYKSGTPDISTNGTVTLTRSDTRGHAYEQMVYGVIFILYCIAQPRKKNNATRYHNWRKLLEQSGVPFHAKNAIDKGVADWLKTTDAMMDKTVRLREEWQRGEAVIRLSPLEARMIAFANGNDDVSEEAINKALSGAKVASGTDGYKLHLGAREGMHVKVAIDQGQTEVEIIGDNFELGPYMLELFETLPQTMVDALPKTPFEKICAIGVFEGLGLKIGRIDHYNSHTRFDLPFPKSGRDYVLSRETLKRITG